MFLIITPKAGNLIAHEARETLSTFTAKSGELLVVVDGVPHTYAMDELVCWHGYPTRAAALVDGADLRVYPALK